MKKPAAPTEDRYSRTAALTGEDGLARLKSAKVLIIGIGGVGSYAAEACARAGIGHLTFMDGDVVVPSNLNRQLVALTSTVGQNKAEVMAARAADIDPGTDIQVISRFYTEDDSLDLTQYDWIVDAIDDVSAKTELIVKASELGVNIISAMGAGGKTGTAFRVSDISETSVCPLARVMRRRLRDRCIMHLPVVYSEEKPVPRTDDVLGTLSYVPGSAGLAMAGYVIRSIAFDSDRDDA